MAPRTGWGESGSKVRTNLGPLRSLDEQKPNPTSTSPEGGAASKQQHTLKRAEAAAASADDVTEFQQHCRTWTKARNRTRVWTRTRIWSRATVAAVPAGVPGQGPQLEAGPGPGARVGSQ